MAEEAAIKNFDVEERVIVRTKDKVCIIGCADNKNLTPFDDDSYEFWGVNNLYGVPFPGAHFDRWFEIHNIDLDDKGVYHRRDNTEFRGQSVNDYIKGIATLDVGVVYMQHEWPEIPKSAAYPIDLITTVYGRYLTNTISYEIALAILMEFKEIHLYGVDMAHGTEYAAQKPSCEYFIGLARGKGIKVIIPDECDLCKNLFLYGFEEKRRDAYAKKIKFVQEAQAGFQAKEEAELARLQAKIKKVEAKVNQRIGVQLGIAELGHIWNEVRGGTT